MACSGRTELEVSETERVARAWVWLATGERIGFNLHGPRLFLLMDGFSPQVAALGRNLLARRNPNAVSVSAGDTTASQLGVPGEFFLNPRISIFMNNTVCRHGTLFHRLRQFEIKESAKTAAMNLTERVAASA